MTASVARPMVRLFWTLTRLKRYQADGQGQIRRSRSAWMFSGSSTVTINNVANAYCVFFTSGHLDSASGRKA
jgi:hypothetical protein